MFNWLIGGDVLSDAANITLQFGSVSKASTLLCPVSLLSGWWDRVQGGNMIITEIIYLGSFSSEARSRRRPCEIWSVQYILHVEGGERHQCRPIPIKLQLFQTMQPSGHTMRTKQRLCHYDSVCSSPASSKLTPIQPSCSCDLRNIRWLFNLRVYSCLG